MARRNASFRKSTRSRRLRGNTSRRMTHPRKSVRLFSRRHIGGMQGNTKGAVPQVDQQLEGINLKVEEYKKLKEELESYQGQLTESQEHTRAQLASLQKEENPKNDEEIFRLNTRLNGLLGTLAKIDEQLQGGVISRYMR